MKHRLVGWYSWYSYNRFQEWGTYDCNCKCVTDSHLCGLIKTTESRTIKDAGSYNIVFDYVTDTGTTMVGEWIW